MVGFQKARSVALVAGQIKALLNQRYRIAASEMVFFCDKPELDRLYAQAGWAIFTSAGGTCGHSVLHATHALLFACCAATALRIRV